MSVDNWQKLQAFQSKFEETNSSTVDYSESSDTEIVITIGDPVKEHREYLDLLRDFFALVREERIAEESGKQTLQILQTKFEQDSARVVNYLTRQGHQEAAEEWDGQTEDLIEAFDNARNFWEKKDPIFLDETLNWVEEILAERVPYYDLISTKQE